MMPVKIGKKRYKSFGTAAGAVARKKKISPKRARAYVATVERAMKGKGKRKSKK
jgi:hypothetical protein